MQIDVQTRDIDLDRALQGRIERRLQFGLTCFQPEVRGVDALLSRERAVGRTPCWRMRICVRFRTDDDLIIEDVEGEVQDAVDRAVDRSVRAVRQRIRFLDIARRCG